MQQRNVSVRRTRNFILIQVQLYLTVAILPVNVMVIIKIWNVWTMLLLCWCECHRCVSRSTLICECRYLQIDLELNLLRSSMREWVWDDVNISMTMSIQCFQAWMLYNQKNEKINMNIHRCYNNISNLQDEKRIILSYIYLNAFHHICGAIVSYLDWLLRREQLHGIPRPTKDWQIQAWQHVHWSTPPVGWVVQWPLCQRSWTLGSEKLQRTTKRFQWLRLGRPWTGWGQTLRKRAQLPRQPQRQSWRGDRW